MSAWIASILLLIVMFVYMTLTAIVQLRRGVGRPSEDVAQTRRRHPFGVAALVLLGASGAVARTDAQAQNVVTHWASVIAPAIHSAGAPRPPGSSEVLHAMVQLAIYDAVVAIEGGYRPYAGYIAASREADVRAAVAAAAYRTARARVAESQLPYLDWHYADYLAGIPAGRAKTDGIAVGEAAAAAMLNKRASDGFNNVVTHVCGSVPTAFAEFEPNAGCGTQPVDTKLGQVTPFTFSDPAAFLPAGPREFDSHQWAREFNETRLYGRADSALRTPEQTDVAYFWSEHAYIHWNRNLNALAISQGLNVRQSARLLAVVHTASADAVIAGFHAKYHFRFVRPRTAIPRAEEDGNPDTAPDATWKPLLTVNHPEYPSAHAFWTQALATALSRYFCDDDLHVVLATSQDAVPQLVKAQRRYKGLRQVTNELDDARVWSGLHWRSSMKDGGKLGAKVARHVAEYFEQSCHQ